jgi:hypothetical protein
LADSALVRARVNLWGNSTSNGESAKNRIKGKPTVTRISIKKIYLIKFKVYLYLRALPPKARLAKGYSSTARTSIDLAQYFRPIA